jgi:hypothetical protein
MPFNRKNKKNNNNGKITNSNQEKGYRSIHRNYSPFLRYVENHALIDDDIVQRMKAKYGHLSPPDSTDINNNNSNNKMASASASAAASSFSSQRTGAMSKAERDDARHEDLHANSKLGNFTDSDKIFLLRREIDNLNVKLKEQRTTSSDKRRVSFSMGGVLSDNAVLFTVVLFFGLVLVSSRFLARRLRLLRASDSLLNSEIGGGGERDYGYHRNHINDEATAGFELQEQPSQHQQQQHQQQQPTGIFGAMASKLAGTANPPGGMGSGVAYEAPPDQMQETTIRFV